MFFLRWFSKSALIPTRAQMDESTGMALHKRIMKRMSPVSPRSPAGSEKRNKQYNKIWQELDPQHWEATLQRLKGKRGAARIRGKVEDIIFADPGQFVRKA